MELKSFIEPIVALAEDAGRAILKVYSTDFEVQSKVDESPLTQADLASHHCIVAGLAELAPDLPIISEESGLPDFEGIKSYLHQAEDYIVSTDMNAAVTTRLNNIERMILLYKADVALSKDTDDALESAIKLLKQAGKLTPSASQSEEITQKIERARARRAELKAAAE